MGYPFECLTPAGSSELASIDELVGTHTSKIAESLLGENPRPQHAALQQKMRIDFRQDLTSSLNTHEASIPRTNAPVSDVSWTPLFPKQRHLKRHVMRTSFWDTIEIQYAYIQRMQNRKVSHYLQGFKWRDSMDITILP
jgi:hypothetical protein